MLKEVSKPTPEPQTSEPKQESLPSRPQRKITSKRPNHIWLVDLTSVPILSGMWTAWFPSALPQCWPFCYWLCVVEDHKSRRVMNVKAFQRPPNSLQVQRLLDATACACGSHSRYLICDKGPQFWNDKFKAWAKRKQVRLRFGAVGQHGSIAIIERLNWTIQYEWLRETSVSPRMQDFQAYLDRCREWHNASRPHMTLRGRTPNEVYFRRSPANEKPRIEPRNRWTRRSPCALPLVKVKGKRGQRFVLRVRRHDGHTNLPIVTLRRVGYQVAKQSGCARGARRADALAFIGDKFATKLPRIKLPVVILVSITLDFIPQSGGIMPAIFTSRKSMNQHSR